VPFSFVTVFAPFYDLRQFLLLGQRLLLHHFFALRQCLVLRWFLLCSGDFSTPVI